MKLNYFYIQIISLNILVFILHIFILDQCQIKMFSNKIIEAYIINTLTAIILFFIINKLKTKFKDSIGFIFMFNSFIKFGLFFFIIYPSYKIDGISSKLEFSTFFIPYTTSLTIEILALIKLLTNLDKKTTFRLNK